MENSSAHGRKNKMTNGNDLIEHEEKNYDRLVEEFIEQNKELWELHILQDYNGE